MSTPIRSRRSRALDRALAAVQVAAFVALVGLVSWLVREGLASSEAPWRVGWSAGWALLAGVLVMDLAPTLWAGAEARAVRG